VDVADIPVMIIEGHVEGRRVARGSDVATRGGAMQRHSLSTCQPDGAPVLLEEDAATGLCGLVCPSRTSERGGEGDCVKEGGGGEGKCERERALERLQCYSPGH
jgi:hypothetical protein